MAHFMVPKVILLFTIMQEPQGLQIRGVLMGGSECYPVVELPPASTTTTIPAEPCTVEFFPRRLSKVMNTVSQLQAFIIRGDENASFSKATTIDWGTASVETLIKSALNKRLIIALVLLNGNNLMVGDTYEVNVDNCTGALPVRLF